MHRIAVIGFMFGMVASATVAAGTVALADFDGDGRPDKVELVAGRVELTLDTAQARPTEPIEPIWRAPTNADFVAAGDFSGDGFSDFALSSAAEKTIWIHAGNGRGGFFDRVPYVVPKAEPPVAMPKESRATFTVTNTNNAGPGSLREAVAQANASGGLDTINFNIPGGGVQLITLTSNILDITSPVIIDGYSQPGSVQNTGTTIQNALLRISLTANNLAGAMINLSSGSSGSTIRGLVINQPNGPGISIGMSDSNQIQGNYLGLNDTGTGLIGNQNAAVDIFFNSSNNIIGTNGDGLNDLGERNLIAGNDRRGDVLQAFNANIFIQSGSLNTVVAGNWIGLSSDGLSSFGTASGPRGVMTLGASNTRIGGLLPAERNLIAGQLGNGIALVSEASGQIRGNYIGTNASGTGAVPNGQGVSLQGCTGGTIGGSVAGAGNVISGNATGAIEVLGTTDPVIQGNLVGTTADGLTALPNSGQVAVVLESVSAAQVGGNTALERNVISGNTVSQGALLVSNGSQIFIRGNVIGLAADGLAALGNSSAGIVLFDDVSQVEIGGGASSANVIASNAGDGIVLMLGQMASSPSIRSNRIGVNSADANRGNGGAGISINSPLPVLVGGSESGNVIAFSGGPGVRIVAGNGHRVSQNRIFGNTGIGIDLNGDGVTPNDLGDGDAGTNQGQNFPIITGLSGVPGSIILTARFNSLPNTQYQIEGYGSAGPNEGDVLINTRMVTTDGSGFATFNLSGPQPPPGRTELSMLAINLATGDTSEFSPGGPPNVTLVSGNGQTALVGNAFDQPLVARVIDSRGDPIGGFPVEFLAPPSGASASISTPMSTSDAAGLFQTTLIANNLAGAYQVIVRETLFGAEAQATLTNSVAGISVGSASIVEGTGGAQTLVFPVSLSASSGSPVTFRATTSFGTAGASDFTALSNALITIPAKASSGTIAVTLNPDNIVEADENFTVTLSQPLAPYLLVDPVATGTILNDDSATLALSGPAPIDEGNSGSTPVTFTATLSSPVDVAVAVNFATVNGTATAPSDYTAASGTLSIAPLSLTTSTNIAVLGDVLPEPDETFSITLSGLNAAGRPVTILTPTASALIRNDDRPTKITLIDTPDPSLVGKPYTVRATVTPLPPATAVPQGTVTITGAEGGCAPITLDAAGSASCTLTSNTSGLQNITAVYTPSSSFYLGASVTVPHQVNLPGVWTPIGPYGGDVLQVGISSADANLAFAANAAGLFRSTDGGASWASAEGGIPQSRGLVNFLTQERIPARYFGQCLSAPDRIYVAAQFGVARSVDAGLSFTPTALATGGGDVVSISCSPSNPLVVAAVGNDQVWRSQNGGSSWTLISVPGPNVPRTVLHLGDRTFIGTASASATTTLLYSAPLSSNAASAEPALPQAALRINQLVPAYGSEQLLVQSDVAVVSATVIAATPLSYSATTIPAAAAIAVAPNASSQLLYATTGGAFESSNLGQTATLVSQVASFGGLPVRPVSVALPANYGADNRSFLLGTTGTGVYRAERIVGNAAPTASNVGIQGFAAQRFSVSADGTQVVAGNSVRPALAPNQTLARSVDGGASFVAAQSGYLPISADAIAQQPGNPSVVLAAGDGASAPLWRSSDGGQSWTASSAGLPATDLIDQIRFHPTLSSVVFAIGRPGPGIARIYRSNDAGQNWVAADSGIVAGSPALAVTDLGFDPVNAQIIYATTATLGRGPSPASATPALYRSNDAGLTWVSVAGAGLPSNGPGRADLRAVLVDPGNANTIFVSAYSFAAVTADPIATAFGIYRSSDGGATFTQKLSKVQITDLVYFAAASPGQEPRIYAVSQPAAGQRADAFFTRAVGNAFPADEWDSLSIGLPSVPVESLQVSTSTSAPVEDALYAGTRQGLYKLVLDRDEDLDGATTTVENAAPNGGDGNNDGQLDSVQLNVASVALGLIGPIPSRGRSNYVTGGSAANRQVEVGVSCAQLNNFVGIEPTIFQPDLIAPSERLKRSYPFGLVSFALPECQIAQVDLIFHDASFTTEFWRWRNYGPTTPGDSTTNAWYDFAGATLISPTTWRLILNANQIGNWRADPNSILTFGGPAFVEPDQDYGDAPESYSTLQEDDGARHLPTGPTLGATRDAEPNGLPSADASGDGSDEDGVGISGDFVRNTNASITITASATGFVNAWADWNRDGDFADAGERMLSNAAVQAGSNNLSVSVPAEASIGPSFMRFRLTTASVAAPLPTGRQPTGEVEDYPISIAANGNFALTGASTSEGSGAGTTSLTLNVTRTGGSGSAQVRVRSADGTALAGSDYVALDQVLTFAGPGSQSVSLLINRDNLVERDETLFVSLSDATAGAGIESAELALQILNDDSAVLSITAPAPFDEGNLGLTNASFGLSLSNPVDVPISVRVQTSDGTATAPADYLALSSVRVLAAEALTANAIVSVLGDTEVELDETFVVTMSELSTGGRAVTLGMPSGATATIRNDDFNRVTQLTLVDSPDPTVTGQSYTVSATVVVVPAGATPTGSVQVSDGTMGCTITLNAGTGSCPFMAASAGPRSLSATYVPDTGDFLASQAGAAHQVNPASTSLSLGPVAATRRGTPTFFPFALTVPAPGAGSPVGVVTVTAGSQSCSAAPSAGGCSITFATAAVRSVSASFVPTGGDFMGSGAPPRPHTSFNLADLSISISNGVTQYSANESLIYVIEARNDGPDDASGIQVVVAPPVSLQKVSWDCAGSGGAVCPQIEGLGSINAGPISVPSGGVLRYLLKGTVASPAPSSLRVPATILLPSDQTTQDPDENDLFAEDVDGGSAIFANGFEAP